MNFEQTPEFKKDLKRLSKKWRSLPSDIKAAETHIVPLYQQLASEVTVEDYRKLFFASKKATILHTVGDIEVVKMRLDCATLGTNKKTRIVFVAVKIKNTIHFVELFAKNNGERENEKRYARFMR